MNTNTSLYKSVDGDETKSLNHHSLLEALEVSYEQDDLKEEGDVSDVDDSIDIDTTSIHIDVDDDGEEDKEDEVLEGGHDGVVDYDDSPTASLKTWLSPLLFLYVHIFFIATISIANTTYEFTPITKSGTLPSMISSSIQEEQRMSDHHHHPLVVGISPGYLGNLLDHEPTSTNCSHCMTPPLWLLCKSSSQSENTCSADEGRSIHQGNAEKVVLSNKGILPRIKPLGDAKTPTIISAEKRVKERSKKPTSILYLAHCDMPVQMMERIRRECHPLWFVLSLTKIGQSESWETFLDKMKSLLTHHSFCPRLKWVAIEHDHPPRLAEQAMHYVFMAYHVRGEWYDMKDTDRDYLYSKFPQANVYEGSTDPPVRGYGWDRDNHIEGPGWVYVTKYDWHTAALGYCAVDTINGIKNDQHEVQGHRKIAKDMLLTKIGSTHDIRKRLSKYIWAQPFASMTYHAFPNITIRAAERHLHHTWDNERVRGEWFNLIYTDDWYLIGNVTYSVDLPPDINVVMGTWHRTREQRNVYLRDLLQWTLSGLVTEADVFFNVLLGLVDVTGLPP